MKINNNLALFIREKLFQKFLTEMFPNNSLKIYIC